MRLEVAGSPNLGLHFSVQRLDELVEHSAARTPDAVCVRSGQEERTFRQLDGFADSIATALQRYGVGTGTFVAMRKTPKPPTRMTETSLANAALFYLSRYASSSGNLRRVLMRKVARSAAYHGDDPAALTAVQKEGTQVLPGLERHRRS